MVWLEVFIIMLIGVVFKLDGVMVGVVVLEVFGIVIVVGDIGVLFRLIGVIVVGWVMCLGEMCVLVIIMMLLCWVIVNSFLVKVWGRCM